MTLVISDQVNAKLYSLKEQYEFLPYVEKRLEQAISQMNFHQRQMDSITDAGKTADREENSASNHSFDYHYQKKLEQKKLKENLVNAKLRITTYHTYGRCTVTGKKIPAERLKSTPHTTVSKEGQEIRERKKTKS